MRRCLAVVLSPLLAACTPSPSTQGAPGGEGGDAGGGGAGGAPGLGFETRPPKKSKPAHVVGGFTIEVPALTLSPGEESHPCYIFPLEIEGPSRVVGGARLTVGPGMHHGNIVTQPKTGEGIRPCPDGSGGLFGGEASAVFDGGAVLFGSSTQIQGEEWQRFPDGMGYPVKDGFEIVAHMHYLNPTSAPIEVAPRYEWFTVDEEKVDHLLAPFAWVLHDWEIPPMSEYTAAASCDVPGPMSLVHVLPHMHRMGRSFRAELEGGPHDGVPFLSSPGYDPENGVMLEYAPPLDLSVAERFRFSCTWRNTLDKPLVYGDGDNEMCILFGYAYPPESAYSALATGGSSCLLFAAKE
jgi:hypothetical protein